MGDALDNLLSAQANGMSGDSLDNLLKARAAASTQPNAPVSMQAGAALNSIPRQLGLTARYALEGPAQAAQIVTEPIRNFITDPISRLFGGKNGKPLGEVASGAADWLGLPTPQGANERVVGDAARLVAGAGATMGAGQVLANLPKTASAFMQPTASSASPIVNLASAVKDRIAVIPSSPQSLGAMLSSAPAQQLSAAAGAGLASGASREAGGNPLFQAGAGVLGGLAGGALPGAANALGTMVQRAATPAWSNMQIDAKISQALSTRDVDYSAIPDAAKQALRVELRQSLQAGKEIDPDAVRRFADFQATGLTPTRGMVTQDPVQITREMNLAKMGANSADGALHGLPMVQNQNNRQLIGNMNTLGAGQGNAFNAGQSAIDGIGARDAQLGAGVTDLYNRARGMAGGDIPIDRAPIINSIFNNLAKENKMAFLPDNIGKMLNDISAGQIKANGQTFDVPFNAQTVDTLKTMLATAQRGTQDGNVKAALLLARKAIDDAPFSVTKTQFGGGQVMPGGLAAQVTAHDAGPGDYMGALNEARTAAAKRFGWQESSRPVETALGGAQPDNFFKRFVVSGTVEDAKSFAQHAGPEQTQNALLGYLKDKALNGAADEVGKFSQAGYNKALKDIGDPKLNAIFGPEQVAQLKAVGRVASYAQAQPVGSAVNNSNSGALMLGRGADLLGNLASKFPLGKQLISTPLQNINVSLSQRQAQNVLPGLLMPPSKNSVGLGLLGPAIAAGGLLSAPTVP